MADDPPKKELSAKEKKAAAKAAKAQFWRLFSRKFVNFWKTVKKAARRAQKVDQKGGATEPEVKKAPKKEEKMTKAQQSKKSGESGKTERTNSDSKQQQRTHVPQKTVTSQEKILKNLWPAGYFELTSYGIP